MGLQVNIDNGGTLTDICIINDGRATKTKVLTTPYDLSKCFFDGLKKASGVVYGEENVARLLEEVDLIRYSTTQGTNAICERKGPKLGLITCGNAKALMGKLAEEDAEVFEAIIGSRVTVIDPARLDDADADVFVVKAINQLTAAGANRLVVSLDVPGYVEAEHTIRRIALRKYPRHLLGAVPILYASDTTSDLDIVRRTWTAIINSFLHPAMEAFLYNAENRLREYRTKNPLQIFRNDGDSSRVAKTVAIKTYSSGPRGGMEGVRAFARLYGLSDVVSIDVGGTTTDIGQFVDGGVTEKRRGHVEGIAISFPLVECFSAGAGGSSIFKVRDGKIAIGPDSVGAVPGPACFGRGGKEATITDATLLSGIFDPASYFGGGLPLDSDRSATAVQLSIAQPLKLNLDEALLRMEAAYEQKIADELARHTRLSKESVLLAFGGAGPLNACGVAEKAGLRSVIVPHMAAVFSAYGIGSCNIAQHYSVVLTQLDDQSLRDGLAALKSKATRDMFAEGFSDGAFELRARMVGTVGGKEVAETLPLDMPSFPSSLTKADYVNLELSAVKVLRTSTAERGKFVENSAARTSGTRTILTANKGRIAVPVYQLAKLRAGDHAAGPAIIEEDYFTCRVRDDWSFVISDHGDILLKRNI